MKQITADKSLLNQILGLSCLENYLLYIMKECGYHYQALYAESFVSFSDIATTLFDEAVPYAYFHKIPRLQATARKKNLLSMAITKNIEEGVSQYDYCCIKVHPDFVIERYGRKPWRDDHYILLCEQRDHKWICLNDNPRDIIELNSDILSHAYAGKTICFHRLTEIHSSLEKRFLKAFQNTVAQPQKIYVPHINNLGIARDIIGILKTTRKRIQEYSSQYMDTAFMTDYLLQLDKTYAIFEYMRVRQKVDFEKVEQMLTRVQTYDFLIIKQLNEKIQKIG